MEMNSKSISSQLNSSKNSKLHISRLNQTYERTEIEITDNPYWNLTFLACAWAWTLTSSTLLTTTAPLAALSLGETNTMAAFTVGIFLLGAALSSLPSASLFKYFGRFKGFSIGCLSQILGSFLGVWGIRDRIPILLYISCFFIGLGQGIGQFYRFSAIEVSPDNLKSLAVTYVLSGGIIAAFLGPISANKSRNIFEPEYTGSFAIMAVIGLLNQFTIMFVKFPNSIKNIHSSSEYIKLNQYDENNEEINNSNHTIYNNLLNNKKLYNICCDPVFIMSCTISTLAHTIMVMLMSNVTLSMDDQNFPFSICSYIMTLHFLAMFSPGFVTGFLIKKYGSFYVSLLGAILFVTSVFILYLGYQEWNYAVGMILVGIAWNLAFSAGTVMLTGCYQTQSRDSAASASPTEIQAINDVIIFSIAAAGSALSGKVFHLYGWTTLIYFVSVLIAGNLLLFCMVWRRQDAAQCAAPQRSEASLYYQSVAVAAIGSEQSGLIPEVPSDRRYSSSAGSSSEGRSRSGDEQQSDLDAGADGR